MVFFQRVSFILLVLLLARVAPIHAQKLEKLVIGYPAPVASLGIIDVMRKGGLFKGSTAKSQGLSAGTFRVARRSACRSLRIGIKCCSMAE